MIGLSENVRYLARKIAKWETSLKSWSIVRAVTSSNSSHSLTELHDSGTVIGTVILFRISNI